MSGRGPLRPRVALMFNHGANGGRGGRSAPLVLSLFRDAGVDVDVLEPGDPACSIARARTALGLDGADRAGHGDRPRALVVAGGDGAVHTGLQAVAGTDVPLAVIPLGSGNDIARDLGLAGASVRAAVDTVVEALHAPWRPHSPRTGLDAPTLVPGRTSHGHVRRMDALEILADGRPPVWALAILSAGLDAAVNQRTNELTWPPGGARYVRALVQELGRRAPYGYRLTVDGVTRDLSATLVAVANLRHFGGGMRVAPQADPSDGLLDVIVLDPVELGTLVRLFTRVYRGTHLSEPQVHVLRGREVRLEALPSAGRTPPVTMADGEPVGALPLTVALRPGAVSVVTRTVGA